MREKCTCNVETESARLLSVSAVRSSLLGKGNNGQIVNHSAVRECKKEGRQEGRKACRVGDLNLRPTFVSWIIRNLKSDPDGSTRTAARQVTPFSPARSGRGRVICQAFLQLAMADLAPSLPP